jgi:hypothetical protein
MIAASVRSIAGSLFGIDVIGKQAFPPGTKPSARHAAACEKFIEASHLFPLRRIVAPMWFKAKHFIGRYIA